MATGASGVVWPEAGRAKLDVPRINSLGKNQTRQIKKSPWQTETMA
jgi:hypothetical protein